MLVGFKDWREFNFPKKIELKLKLKDILQDNPNSKYYLSTQRIKSLEKNKRSIGFTDANKKNVANCIIASYHKLPTDGEYIEVPKKYYLSEKMKNFVLKTNFREAKPIDVNKISPCIKVGGDVPCFEEDEIIVHNLHPRCGDPKKGGTGRLSKSDGTAYFLDTGNSQAIEKNKKRRLTPLECWRLQGFTDEEFWNAQKVNSDTQLYKQAGNSITVNVMVKLLNQIYN